MEEWEKLIIFRYINENFIKSDKFLNIYNRKMQHYSKKRPWNFIENSQCLKKNIDILNELAKIKYLKLYKREILRRTSNK